MRKPLEVCAGSPTHFFCSLKRLGNHLASQGTKAKALVYGCAMAPHVDEFCPPFFKRKRLRPVHSETACNFLKMFGRSYELFQGGVSFGRLNTSHASLFDGRDALSWSQQSDIRILREALQVLPPR